MAIIYTVETRSVAFPDPEQPPVYSDWFLSLTTGDRQHAVGLAARCEEIDSGLFRHQARIRETPETIDVVRERVRRCAIVMHNGDAPAGWVEVQRDDETSDAEYADEDAANDVCEVAGVPGVARRYAADTFKRLDAVDVDPDIIVVPAVAAFKAGLIDEQTMHIALSEGL